MINIVQLSREFYDRPTFKVAQELIGKSIITNKGSGVIVETEAYLGATDGASHARFKKNNNNYPIFGAVGRAYIYRSQGINDTFCIVAHAPLDIGYVKIRAMEPFGIDGNNYSNLNQPHKITKVLEITREHNGLDLVSDKELTIFVTTGTGNIAPDQVKFSIRIDVPYARAEKNMVARFYLEASLSVPTKIIDFNKLDNKGISWVNRGKK